MSKRRAAPRGPDLFDLARARAARDAALARVAEGASPGWRARALEAVARTCRRLPEWIVDDVWRDMDPADRPAEARAMGPVVLAAARAGLCRRTERVRPSAQVRCHANPRRVWESLTYGRGG